MSVKRPDFLDSPYFVDEPGNWHLKPGAPRHVVKEFTEFMEDSDCPELPEIDLNTMPRFIRTHHGKYLVARPVSAAKILHQKPKWLSFK